MERFPPVLVCGRMLSSGGEAFGEKKEEDHHDYL